MCNKLRPSQLLSRFCVLGLSGLASLAVASTPLTLSCHGNYTVHTPEDLAQLVSCGKTDSTFPGNITVASWPLSASSSTIDLSDLVTIQGSLTFSNISGDDGVKLTVKASSLTQIQGNLTFANIRGLSAKNGGDFPVLHSDSLGSIIYQNVTFAEAEGLNISNVYPALKKPVSIEFSGTNVESITGWQGPVTGNLKRDNYQAPLSLTVLDNTSLGNVSFSGYTGETVTVNIAGNGRGLSVSLPDLTNASNLILSNASSFSAQQLDHVSQANFSGNEFQSLDLSKLASVDLDLSIIQNNALTELLLESLQRADGLYISSNPRLQNISLPQLSHVTTLDVFGPINQLDIPSLGDSTTVNITVYPPGTFTCANATGQTPSNALLCQIVPPCVPTSSVTPAPQGVGSGRSGRSSGGDSKAVKLGVGLGVGLGLFVFILLGLAWWMLVFRRYPSPRQRRRNQAESKAVAQSREALNEEPNSSARHGKIPYLIPDEKARSDHHPSASGLLAGGRNSAGRELGGGGKAGIQNDNAVEEQQGPRHEMDARSLPDIEMDEEENNDERSLEDIERIRARSP